MHISEDLILKLERMARLRLMPDERTKLADGLGRMLEMVAKLEEVDTDGVEPLVHLTDRPTGQRNDVPQTTLSRDQALALAPRHDGQYFRVPKVIDPSQT